MGSAMHDASSRVTGFNKGQTGARAFTPHAALRKMARAPVVQTVDGLRVGGVMQLYRFEEKFQRAFARHVLKNGLEILNIGYGLGFSYQEFLKAGAENLSLVELNHNIAIIAIRNHNVDKSRVYISSWQKHFTEHSNDIQSVVYFDAFPSSANFDYSAIEMRRYIQPFLGAVLLSPNVSKAYFVVFDCAPIRLTAPDGRVARRVLSYSLPENRRTANYCRASLYEWSRSETPGLPTPKFPAKLAPSPQEPLNVS